MRRFTVLAATLSLAAPLVLGAGLGFMSNTPLTRLKPSELDSLNQSVTQALNESKDGQATQWASPDTDASSSRATAVEIVPVRSYKHGGLDCRAVQLSFSSKMQNDRMTPAYCKTADGSWKLQAAGKKRPKASSAE